MNYNQVTFHTEDILFNLPFKASIIKDWLIQLALVEDKKLFRITYIFCSDHYLHKINLEYLNHDTLTDIITFPYSDNLSNIEGDIFISIDRIRENAITFKASFEEELVRVIAHGLLHLCGYQDKTDEEKELMREKEAQAISIFFKKPFLRLE